MINIVKNPAINFVIKSFFILCFFCCLAKKSYATGAYVVDDGGIVNKNTLQIENWYNRSNDGEQIFVTNPAYQLLPNAEFSIQETYDEKAPKMNTLWPQVKYLWLEKEHVLSSAVVGVNYATNSGAGIYGSFFYIPTTIEFNELIHVNIDVGMQNWKVAQGNSNFFIGGVGVEWNIKNDLFLFTEIFRNSNKHQMQIGDYFSSTFITGSQIGLRYSLSKHVMLDGIYGKDIIGLNNDWATLGVTLLF